MHLFTTLIGISLLTTVSMPSTEAPNEPIQAYSSTSIQTTEEVVLLAPKAFVAPVVKPVVAKPQAKAIVGNEIIEYIRSKDWDGEKAIRVANCESGLNPKAYNGKGRDNSVGIFQINLYGSLASKRPSREWLEDYRNNVDYAYEMWKTEGWKPWTCAKKV